MYANVCCFMKNIHFNVINSCNNFSIFVCLFIIQFLINLDWYTYSLIYLFFIDQNFSSQAPIEIQSLNIFILVSDSPHTNHLSVASNQMLECESYKDT